jgi:hypothetical protein
VLLHLEQAALRGVIFLKSAAHRNKRPDFSRAGRFFWDSNFDHGFDQWFEKSKIQKSNNTSSASPFRSLNPGVESRMKTNSAAVAIQRKIEIERYHKDVLVTQLWTVPRGTSSSSS